MGKGAISSKHRLYLGNIGIHGSYAANHAVSECDLLISIGTRFNDRITGKISEFAKDAKIVHIDIDSASIFKKYCRRHSYSSRCKTCHRKTYRVRSTAQDRKMGRTDA